MEVEVLRTVGNSVSKRALGMMHVPWRCLDSICHSVASENQEAIWTMYGIRAKDPVEEVLDRGK